MGGLGVRTSAPSRRSVRPPTPVRSAPRATADTSAGSTRSPSPCATASKAPVASTSPGRLSANGPPATMQIAGLSCRICRASRVPLGKLVHSSDMPTTP